MRKFFTDEIGSAMAGKLSSASSFGATTPVLVAEIDLATIAQATEHAERFKEIDRYPAVTRDVAMFVGPEVTHAEIVGVIAAANEALLEKVGAHSIYLWKMMPKNCRKHESRWPIH